RSSARRLPIVSPRAVRVTANDVSQATTPVISRVGDDSTSVTQPSNIVDISRLPDELVHRHDVVDMSDVSVSGMSPDVGLQPLLTVTPQTGQDDVVVERTLPVTSASVVRPSPPRNIPPSSETAASLPVVTPASEGSVQLSRDAEHRPSPSSTELVHVNRALDTSNVSRSDDTIPIADTTTVIQRQSDDVPSDVDVDQLADTIYRKLMRRLSIERERRGGESWH
ncbi:MAG: hypothetical protein D6737_02625, partial [Chloroflexi bacterium]